MRSRSLYVSIVVFSVCPSCTVLFGPYVDATAEPKKHVEWTQQENSDDLYQYDVGIHAVERFGQRVQASGTIRVRKRVEVAVAYAVIEERRLLRKTLWDAIVGNETAATRYRVPCAEYSTSDAQALKDSAGHSPPKPGSTDEDWRAPDFQPPTVVWRLVAEDGTQRGDATQDETRQSVWSVTFPPDVVQWAAAQRQPNLTLEVELGAARAELSVPRQLFVDALGGG